jgi:hypothetical protein
MISKELPCFGSTRVYLPSMPSTPGKEVERAVRGDPRAEGERALEGEKAPEAEITLEIETPTGRRARVVARKASRDRDPLLPEVAQGGRNLPRAKSIFCVDMSRAGTDVPRARNALILTIRESSMATASSAVQVLLETIEVGLRLATNPAGQWPTGSRTRFVSRVCVKKLTREVTLFKRTKPSKKLLRIRIACGKLESTR